jgi:drug/metabolite transporter (DMT)-like permease
VLSRFVVQAVVLIPLVRATGRSFAMTPLGWRLTVLRTALQVAGIWLMVTGLTYLPLADAIAIAFVMPFILLLLGHLLLGETVGRRRLTACAFGFCGTLMVMQPSFVEVGWPVLYPLAVAFVFAAFMLVTRRIAAEADPIAMQGASGAMAVAGLGAAYLLLPNEGLLALTPLGADWPLWLAMGLTGTAAHLLMTWSLRFAPASTLAPLQYLEIPMAALIGLAVFGDWPDGLALVGIGVTIATGLYILWRENLDRGAVA